MATEILTKFTFRTYSEEEENLLKKAQEHFREQSTLKAIKKSLAYVFNELPGQLKRYKEIEKKYNKLQQDHERLIEAIKQRENAEKEICKIIGE
jgi:hypothetical protein